MYVFPASFSKGLHAGFSHASWSNIHGSRGKRFALLFVLHSGFVYARCTLAFFRACTSRYHNHNASILNARPRATKTRRVRGNVEEKAKINRSESFGLAVVRCSGFGYTPYSIRVQLTPHTGRPTWCAPVRAGWLAGADAGLSCGSGGFALKQAHDGPRGFNPIKAEYYNNNNTPRCTMCRTGGPEISPNKAFVLRGGAGGGDDYFTVHSASTKKRKFWSCV